MEISVVVPIRCDGHCGGHDALRSSLRALERRGAEVLVADGSDPKTIFPRHGSLFEGLDHLAVTPAPGANGKVTGVKAGIAAASHERIVVMDDDIVAEPSTLAALARHLDDADLVVPQNHFVRPAPWHASWDTARTLINRAAGYDYPGTMAVRRSTFLHMGGYDEDVLFENLELIRTVRAAGGRVRWQPDLFVAKLAPTFRTFAHQRVRQAYDDLGQPLRLVVEASIVPIVVWTARRRPEALGWSALAVIGIAEIGRRRDGGRSRFPVAASLLAPMWLAERATCVWIAVGARLFRGGVRYRGGRLRRAASSPARLRRRFRLEDASTNAFHHTAASSAISRSDTVGRSAGEPRSPSRPRR